VKLVRSTPPDAHVAFRLANSMLAAVDVLCDKLDTTRSQFFRGCIRERIRALEPDYGTPPVHETNPPTAASNETKSSWSPELYERLKRQR
jgi:hypothetical protein